MDTHLPWARRATVSRGTYRPRSQTLLLGILAASILSTALHYTHNYIDIDHYPRNAFISPTIVRVAIVVFWPILTAIGLLGYWLYSRLRYPAAYACLAIYSVTGLSTFGHFLDGSPDIAPFWYATVFTDGLTGVALLGFTIWSAASSDPSKDREFRATMGGAPPDRRTAT